MFQKVARRTGRCTKAEPKAATVDPMNDGTTDDDDEDGD